MRLLPLLAALIATTAQAQIYRWVDAQGQVHYTQTPPPNQPATAVPLAPRPAATPAPAPAKPAPGLSEQAKAIDAANEAAAKAEAQSKAEAAQKAEMCTRARDRLAMLQERTARRLFVQTPEGQQARMTEEQFNQEVANAEATIKVNCR